MSFSIDVTFFLWIWVLSDVFYGFYNIAEKSCLFVRVFVALFLCWRNSNLAIAEANLYV
jgi:hypothetical protein